MHPNLLTILWFEINKVNPFPALTAPFPLIFLSKLFISFEAKMLTNPGKEIAIFVSAFFSKSPNQEPKDPSDWINLDIRALLNFISLTCC